MAGFCEQQALGEPIKLLKDVDHVYLLRQRLPHIIPTSHCTCSGDGGSNGGGMGWGWGGMGYNGIHRDGMGRDDMRWEEMGWVESGVRRGARRRRRGRGRGQTLLYSTVGWGAGWGRRGDGDGCGTGAGIGTGQDSTACCPRTIKSALSLRSPPTLRRPGICRTRSRLVTEAPAD